MPKIDWISCWVQYIKQFKMPALAGRWSWHYRIPPVVSLLVRIGVPSIERSLCPIYLLIGTVSCIIYIDSLTSAMGIIMVMLSH